jgi:hypothetical protein
VESLTYEMYSIDPAPRLWYRDMMEGLRVGF